MSKLLLITLGWLIVAGLVCVNHYANAELRAVQDGVVSLLCPMPDGERIIKKGMVIDNMNGVWLFKNGHAKNCEIVKGGDL